MHRIVARSIAPLAAAPRRLGTLSLAALAAFATVLPAAADDLDVYRARFDARQRPNILFVLDFSGSMKNDLQGRRVGPAKIDILRGAVSALLEGNEGQINAGVGSIFGGVPSGVRWPVAPLDAEPSTVDPDIPPGYTMSDVITGQLEARAAGGDTRTVDALVEAAQYFRGGEVRNGGMDPKMPARHAPDGWVEGASPGTGRYAGGRALAAVSASYAPDRGYWRDRFEAGNYDVCANYTESGGIDECAGRTVVAGSCVAVAQSEYRNEDGIENQEPAHRRCRYERGDDWDAPRYAPPEPLACQANAIVLISDGMPVGTSGDDAALEALIGTGRDGCEDLSATVFADAPIDGTPRTDGNCGPELVSALASTPLVPGVPDTAVRTYTVGFDVDGPGKTYLQRLAAAGRIDADDGGGFFSADRPEELGAALQAIVDDVAGGPQSFAEMSVGVDRATFSSSDRAFLSLFEPSRRRGWSGNLKGYFLGGDGLVDLDGRAATDAEGGFADTARSFWSAGADGAAVGVGGASGKLAGATRTLYTDAGDGSDLGDALTLEIDPTDVTAADLGLPADSDEVEAVLEWLRTAPMGDPLHSKSVGVDYGDRQVVYVMTNQGLLHAIDASAPTAPGDGTAGTGSGVGGEELFAYMPHRLLSNLPALASGEVGDEHVYGLDGSITRWHEDDDGDGVVDAGESLLLVLGMRRGGTAYHAIDVSDPLAPRLEWVVDSSTTGFGRLAQTWSRASLLEVRRGEGTERVLAFGGGYDAAALDGGSKRRAARGDAVFLADRDGNLVRRFEANDMDYSIAADLTAIDSDVDGLADRLYAADVGGQLWRIDFDDPWAAAGAVTRLADLHVGGDDAVPQPLFAAPSVSLVRGGGTPFLAVAIGSGDRTDPLDETLERPSSNALFMVRDENVAKGAPAGIATVADVDDLYDASADALSSADADVAAVARTALDGARGWRVTLQPGEKALSRTVVFEGLLLATTYAPESEPDADPCTYDEVRRFHVLDVATARAGDLETGGLAAPGASRARSLDGSGIPSTPVVVYPKASSRVDFVVGNEIEETSGRTVERVYWHAR